MTLRPSKWRTQEEFGPSLVTQGRDDCVPSVVLSTILNAKYVWCHCRGVDVEAGQPSRSLPGQDEWRRKPLAGSAQRAPQAAAELELPEITGRSNPPVSRSRSSRVFGHKDRRQGSADVPASGDRRASLDRRGSTRLPEAFGNFGRAVRKTYGVSLSLFIEPF